MTDEGGETRAAKWAAIIFACCIIFVLLSLFLEYLYNIIRSRTPDEEILNPGKESTDKKDVSLMIEDATTEVPQIRNFPPNIAREGAGFFKPSICLLRRHDIDHFGPIIHSDIRRAYRLFYYGRLLG